jgi:hypothetical protein
MIGWTSQLLSRLHHKSFIDSTGAFAGLATAVSVIFGLLAAHFSPHGFGRLAVALHFHRAPLLLRLAPFIAAIALALATAAGFLRFYAWCRERRTQVEPPPTVDDVG